MHRCEAEPDDPEEVRELLTTYFDTCKALIILYGGVVEKFIGDAVMAVWDAPVAYEVGGWHTASASSPEGLSTPQKAPRKTLRT
jgi:class 3 adenylate cyclase